MRVKVTLLFVLVQAKAFAPSGPIISLFSSYPVSSSSSCSTIDANLPSSTSSSPTVLYGLRTFLRNKLFPQRSGSNEPKPSPIVSEEQVEGSVGLPNLLAVESTIGATPSISVASSITMDSVSRDLLANNASEQSSQQLAADAGTATAVLTETDDKDSPVLKEPIITLPPRDEAQLTKFEREYRNMLTEFLQYTKQEDISHVTSPRLRALFEGIAASYHIPEVYRAFEILFEDYAPLRIGGRLIYAQLKQAMLEAQVERQKEVESLSQVTGLSKEEIEANRVAWLKMAVHHTDDKAAQLSIQQLIDFGLAETVAEVLGHDDFEGWLDSFHQNLTRDEVTFCELMMALQNCSVDSVRPECTPNTLLPEIAKRLEPRQNILEVRPLSEKKKRYIERYDAMVRSFLEWKGNVPADKKSRKMDVLRGCFVGAENAEIIDALRIVYVDYSALRFAGDLIFKVMKSLVGSTKVSQNT